ncbi:MAG: four helix bundle protein [Deltaproteobacteria bacterium]|nr:four helix bundle protein [Deltaproteobacteria bacterium]
MNYKRFEELLCWNKARELCRAVFDLINHSKIKSDFSLRDQIWRASGSVMDNIAEGFDDGSTAETRKQIKGFRKYFRSYKSKLTSKAK